MSHMSFRNFTARNIRVRPLLYGLAHIKEMVAASNVRDCISNAKQIFYLSQHSMCIPHDDMKPAHRHHGATKTESQRRERN